MSSRSHSHTLILNAHKIQKIYKNPVDVEILKSISLKLMAGQSIAIMGASGEGKSTLLHILGTLESPTSGSLEICSKTIQAKNRCSIRNCDIGFIFQSFHLLEDYSTLDNILIPAKIARKSTKKNSMAYLRAEKLLDHVGLRSRAHFSTKVLSGGEKQRVSIARALCNDPKIILADEPTGNLDHQTSLKIHQLLMGTCKRENKGLIIVTHDPELAKLCDLIYRLENGLLSPIS